MSETSADDGPPRILCGLVGEGIGRSLTPSLHHREGARHGLTYVYRRIDLQALGLTPEQGAALVRPAAQLGFTGLNVTHPCKQLVLAHVDELSPTAELIGAVNTVVFADGRVIGHNTDVTGFAHGFGQQLAGAPTGRVVQIGTGGAGAAVAHALIGLGVRELVLSDIDPARAARTAEAVSAGTDTRVEVAPPERLAIELSAADGVVNCTPVGMAHLPGSPVDPGLLEPRHWVLDVIYRPLETELVRAARARGCRVATGAGMAIGQAAESFSLFTGRGADAAALARDFAALVASESSATGAAGGIPSEAPNP